MLKIVERVSGQFNIVFPENYENDADVIITGIEFAQNVVENHFPSEFNLVLNVQIKISENPSEADVELDWCYMKTNTNDRIIYLNSPTNAYKYDNQYDDIWYKANLIHEYVHIVVAKFIWDNTGKVMDKYPKWFTEGIAGYVPYYHSNSTIYEKYESRLEKVEDDIVSGLDFDSVSKEVYFGGAVLVKNMYEKYEQDTIIEMLRSPADEWESVVMDVLKIPYPEFKRNLI